MSGAESTHCRVIRGRRRRLRLHFSMPNFRALFSKVALRKAVFFVHLWLGLIVGIYFTVAGITGSVLVFKEDIETHWIMPERTGVKPPTADAQLMPLSQIIAQLRAEFPQTKDNDFSLINPPEQPGGAYFLRLPVDKKSYATTVDPYTGKVIRQFLYQDTWLNWIDDLHVDLLQKAPGKIANGYLGLLAGVLLLSGIWLWWPKNWRQIKIRSTIKRGGGANRIIADLHNVLGIYSLLLLLVVTLTGSVIVFHQPIQKFVISLVGKPKPQRAPQVNPSPGAQRLPVDQLLPAAEKIAPESSFVFILFPTKPRQAFQCYKRAKVGILPDTSIFIDPYNGKVLRVDREITAPLSRKIMRSASGLHFGRWGYFGIKIVYALLGLIPLGLFITGVLMYLKSRRAKAKSKARRAEQRV